MSSAQPRPDTAAKALPSTHRHCLAPRVPRDRQPLPSPGLSQGVEATRPGQQHSQKRHPGFLPLATRPCCLAPHPPCFSESCFTTGGKAGGLAAALSTTLIATGLDLRSPGASHASPGHVRSHTFAVEDVIPREHDPAAHNVALVAPGPEGVAHAAPVEDLPIVWKEEAEERLLSMAGLAGRPGKGSDAHARGHSLGRFPAWQHHRSTPTNMVSACRAGGSECYVRQWEMARNTWATQLTAVLVPWDSGQDRREHGPSLGERWTPHRVRLSAPL